MWCEVRAGVVRGMGCNVVWSVGWGGTECCVRCGMGRCGVWSVV